MLFDWTFFGSGGGDCVHCCVHFNVREERCQHGRLKHVQLDRTCDECKRVLSTAALDEALECRLLELARLRGGL